MKSLTLKQAHNDLKEMLWVISIFQSELISQNWNIVGTSALFSIQSSCFSSRFSTGLLDELQHMVRWRRNVRSCLVKSDCRPSVLSALWGVIASALSFLDVLPVFAFWKWTKQNFPYEPSFHVACAASSWQPLFVGWISLFPTLKTWPLFCSVLRITRRTHRDVQRPEPNWGTELKSLCKHDAEL